LTVAPKILDLGHVEKRSVVNEELLLKLVAATRQMDQGSWTFEERRPEYASPRGSIFYVILTDSPARNGLTYPGANLIVSDICSYAEASALCEIHNLLVEMVTGFEE
jgi:hypothetical protein